MPTELEQFAFNQARFVFATARTVEREMMCFGVPEEVAFQTIRKTPFGQKMGRY